MSNTYKFSSIIFCLFLIISFFYGYNVQEIHGASDIDANGHTWPAINSFNKENFYETLLTYGKFGENSYPLHHIIYGKLLNFNSGNIIFTLTTTLISFLYTFLIYYVFKSKFKELSLYTIIFLSLLILSSPYFRGSAYWGLTENTGYIFLGFAIYFFNKSTEKKDFSMIHFYLCIFSALALYARPQLIFFTIFILLFYFFLVENKKIFLNLIFTFFCFSLPGFFLIWKWGGLIDEKNYPDDFEYFVNIYTIPQTFMVILSLMAVYLFPFFILNNLSKFNFAFLKKIFLNTIIFSLVLFLFFIFLKIDILYLDEERILPYGQGFVIYLSYLITKIDYSFIPIAAFGLFLCIEFTKISKKNLLIFFSIVLIFSLRVHFFTEYLDPLILILALILFDHKTEFKVNLEKSWSIYLMFFYYSCLLYGKILIL